MGRTLIGYLYETENEQLMMKTPKRMIKTGQWWQVIACSGACETAEKILQNPVEK